MALQTYKEKIKADMRKQEEIQAAEVKTLQAKQRQARASADQAKAQEARTKATQQTDVKKMELETKEAEKKHLARVRARRAETKELAQKRRAQKKAQLDKDGAKQKAIKAKRRARRQARREKRRQRREQRKRARELRNKRRDERRRERKEKLSSEMHQKLEEHDIIVKRFQERKAKEVDRKKTEEEKVKHVPEEKAKQDRQEARDEEEKARDEGASETRTKDEQKLARMRAGNDRKLAKIEAKINAGLPVQEQKIKGEQATEEARLAKVIRRRGLRRLQRAKQLRDSARRRLAAMDKKLVEMRKVANSGHVITAQDLLKRARRLAVHRQHGLELQRVRHLFQLRVARENRIKAERTRKYQIQVGAYRARSRQDRGRFHNERRHKGKAFVAWVGSEEYRTSAASDRKRLTKLLQAFRTRVNSMNKREEVLKKMQRKRAERRLALAKRHEFNMKNRQALTIWQVRNGKQEIVNKQMYEAAIKKWRIRRQSQKTFLLRLREIRLKRLREHTWKEKSYKQWWWHVYRLRMFPKARQELADQGKEQQ